MKASLKLRDDHKPLLRAKLPIKFLNFPFQSGIVAGTSDEHALHLTTFFESGPSIKLAYKPYDGFNPFALIVKTGTGKYGSPIDSYMVMSAQFNLSAGGNGNPSFFVHFKPRFGDFGIRTKQCSVFAENGNNVVDNSSNVKKVESFKDKLLKGVEIGAVTSLPVLNLANVKFQWGVRFPTELKNMFGVKDGLVINRPIPAVSFRSFPFLAMSKISIEHVGGGRGKDISQDNSVLTLNGAGEGDVKIMCLRVRNELEALRDENGMLRKAMEELRLEISGGKMEMFAGEVKHREVVRGSGNKPMDSRAEIRLVDLAKGEGNKH